MSTVFVIVDNSSASARVYKNLESLKQVFTDPIEQFSKDFQNILTGKHDLKPSDGGVFIHENPECDTTMEYIVKSIIN